MFAGKRQDQEWSFEEPTINWILSQRLSIQNLTKQFSTVKSRNKAGDMAKKLHKI